VYIKNDKYFQDIADSINSSGKSKLKFQPLDISTYFKDRTHAI